MNYRNIIPARRTLAVKQRHFLYAGVTAVAAFLSAVFLGGLFKLSGSEKNLTSEEQFDKIVPYHLLATEGDARIKRIMGLLRKSQKGEDLYQYAAAKELQFQWRKSTADDLGSYGKGLVSQSPEGSSDHDLTLTNVHEIRHGWQDKTLKTKEWKSDPAMAWQMRILQEVDACAYTAHYAANYKDETGIRLALSAHQYGNETITFYVAISPLKRRFFEHAVLPCFAEIKNYQGYYVAASRDTYNVLGLIKAVYDIAQIDMALAHHRQRLYDPGEFRKYINPPSVEEKAKLFSRFFSLDIKEGTILPELEEMSRRPQDFLAWIEQMIYPEPELHALIDKSQGHFYRVRELITEQEKVLPAQYFIPGTAPQLP